MSFIRDNMPPLMFGGMILCMLVGFPAAFSLAAAGLFFGFLGIEAELLHPDFLGNLTYQLFGIVSNDLLLSSRVFLAELAYAGVFTLNGLPDETVEPVLLVECPRILFPFARNILADITRDGGFPPVLVQPIDFLALWQSRRGQQQAPATA